MGHSDQDSIKFNNTLKNLSLNLKHNYFFQKVILDMCQNSELCYATHWITLGKDQWWPL